VRKFLQQGAGSGSPAGGQPRQHARSQRTARTPSGGARLAQRTSRNHGTAGRHPTDNLQSGCQHHPERLSRVQASGGGCLLSLRLEKEKTNRYQYLTSSHCRKETVHAVPSLGVPSNPNNNYQCSNLKRKTKATYHFGPTPRSQSED